MNNKVERIQGALEDIKKANVPQHLQEAALNYLLYSDAQEEKAKSSSVNQQNDEESQTLSNVEQLNTMLKHADVKSAAVAVIPFLFHWARKYDGKDSLDEEGLLDIYQLSGRKIPGNLKQSMRDLSSKRYKKLEPVKGKRGHFRLTRPGEVYVYNKLTNAETQS